MILGRAEPGDPRWPIAHRYGFLNAGGGSWYWKPLRTLEPGHRVFAYASGAGYVGIGHITGTVIPHETPTSKSKADLNRSSISQM